jgi:signal transduction histidine kinase
VAGLWPYWWGFYPKAGIGEIPFIIWFYILMVLSFRNFIESYRTEKVPIKKKQSKLVIAAFIFGFIGSLDFVANFGIPLYTFAALIVLFFTTTIAYTIINYKLLEIETVIHKTVAWFFTTLSLIIPLAGFLYFTKPWYIKFNAAAAWGYFIAASFFFLFLVRNLQPKVDHFFQRRKYDMENALNRFSDELVHLRGLEDLVNRIINTLMETVYVNKIILFLYSEKSKKFVTIINKNDTAGTRIEIDPNSHFLQWVVIHNRIINREFVDIDPVYEEIRQETKAYLQDLDIAISIPLILNNRLIGLINLGKKVNLKPFNSFDFQFLTNLKNQATIAISNSLVYDRVEELVKIRTEELIRAQKQLIQAEKMATVGTLAGGVAHEINNPLTAILTNVQMLLTSSSIDDKLDRESLELIEEATKRCRTIVQKLMTYARKPLETTQITKVNLLDVVKNVNSFIGYQLEQDNIKLNISAPDDAYFVMGSHNELEQVLTNIILNGRDAIKKAKKSGNIDILFSITDESVKVDIKDEGEGIPENITSKIFDPFFTTKGVGRGVGLGLSICQAIVEKHKGSINFKSKVGEGTIFTLLLPRIKKGVAAHVRNR